MHTQYISPAGVAKALLLQTVDHTLLALHGLPDCPLQ